MTEEEIKLVDEYVNWLYPIKGKSTFTLSDAYAEKLGESRLRSHPNWIGESNEMFKVLNKFGLMERKELNQEYLTDLAIEVYEANGWNNYQIKRNKKLKNAEKRERRKDWKEKYWWFIAAMGYIGGISTPLLSDELKTIFHSTQDKTTIETPLETKKDSIQNDSINPYNRVRDSI